MPLWRDPLDELIDGLERGLPAPAGGPAFNALRSFEELQYAVSISQQGKEAWARATERDPRVRAVLAYLARGVARQQPDGDGEWSK